MCLPFTWRVQAPSSKCFDSMVRRAFRLTKCKQLPLSAWRWLAGWLLPFPALDSCHHQTYTTRLANHTLSAQLALSNLTRLPYRTLPSLTFSQSLASSPAFSPIIAADRAGKHCPPLSTRPQQSQDTPATAFWALAVVRYLRSAYHRSYAILRGTSCEPTHMMAPFSYLMRLGKRDADDGDNGGLGEDMGDGQYSGGDTYDEGDYSWWWSPVRT